MDFIRKQFSEAATVLEAFSTEENFKHIEKAGDVLADCLTNGNKIISCGNGGSMSDAMHFAEELSGRYRGDRKSLSAIAISDSGHITCVGNDYGYDKVFSRFVEGWGRKGDTLLAISTSGNSENVIKAVESAHQRGMKVIGLLGKTGGKLKDMVDIPLVVPSDITDRIQEIHIKCIHILIEGVERSLFPENYA